MSKAIQGVAMVGAAVGMGAAAFFNPALLASPLFNKIWATTILAAAADFAGAIGDALTSNRGMGITSRQVAGYRQIVYGPQRIGGVIIYRSTTGSSLDTFNMVIVLSKHELNALTGLYLDGRKVYFRGSGDGWGVRNGVGFGGWADSDDHIAPDGSTYNFGDNVYAEARYGDQVEGDVMESLTANDDKWAATPDGRSPWVGGCAYLYLHLRRDPALFPGDPEIRIDVQGKNDIYDPRTDTRGYTSNWALVVADLLGDGGLGAPVNQAQLIAAANLCEEQVDLAAGGTECRWLCGWHFDTSTAPGDVLQALMPVAAGRISFVGGEWYVYPGAWSAPEFEWDESMLAGPVKEDPFRKGRDMVNRMGGTYTAPNWPYNPDYGNLYDQNGWYNGTREDTFALQWQSTSFPAYARDERHGYGTDQDYLADGGGKRKVGDLDLRPCLSITQAQRAAKIAYMRRRVGQFSATYPMMLPAFEMMPNTVFGFTFKALGDPRRVLEVENTRFSVAPPPERRDGQGGGDVPAFLVEHDVRSTGPEVYEWDTTEEMTVYNAPAMSQINSPYKVAPPTGLTLSTVTSTSSNPGVGGDSTNFAIAVGFVAPLDASVITIESQIRPHSTGDGGWIDGDTASVASSVAHISGVDKDAAYDVRIRGLRATGAPSAWVSSLATYPSGYTV